LHAAVFLDASRSMNAAPRRGDAVVRKIGPVPACLRAVFRIAECDCRRIIVDGLFRAEQATAMQESPAAIARFA
jgi:hypothetical protein